MKLEIRRQKPEAGSQRPEGRDQKPEARGQKPEARFFSVFCSLASGFCLLLILAGCATEPQPVPPPPPMIAPQTAPAPAAPEETKPPEPAPPPKPPPALPSEPPSSVSTAAPAPARDESIMAIDSQPAGAIVVVNNIPIGKTPQRLKVKASAQGFFHDYVTVKVRFLATSAGETSQTVESDFTPLQKIPVGVLFTPAGAQRRDK